MTGTLGNKIHCSPRDESLSIYYFCCETLNDFLCFRDISDLSNNRQLSINVHDITWTAFDSFFFSSRSRFSTPSGFFKPSLDCFFLSSSSVGSDLETANDVSKLTSCWICVIKQLVHASAVRMSRYWARGKFGEHERGVRVARGTVSCNSSLFEPCATLTPLSCSPNFLKQNSLT